MPRRTAGPRHNTAVAAAAPPVVYVLDNFDDEEIIILDDSDDEKDVIVLDDFDEDDEEIVEVIQPAKGVAAKGVAGVIQTVGVMQPPVAVGLLQPASVDELKSPVTLVNPTFLDKDMATRQEPNGEGKKFVIRFPRSSGGSSPSLPQTDDPSGGNPPAYGGGGGGGGGKIALNFPRSRDSSSSSASNSEREGGKAEIIDSAVVGKGQENIVKLSGFANNPAEHGAFDMKEGPLHITSSIVSSSLGVVPRVPATRLVTATTRIMNEKDVVDVADRYKVIEGSQEVPRVHAPLPPPPPSYRQGAYVPMAPYPPSQNSPAFRAPNSIHQASSLLVRPSIASSSASQHHLLRPTLHESLPKQMTVPSALHGQCFHQLHNDRSGKQHRGDVLPHLRQGLAHIVEDEVKTTLKKRYNRSDYDVSHLIPVKILLPHEWETTSLQSFSVNECAALKKTGCAKVSINGVPSLTKLQSSLPDQISLLFQLTHGKLTAYMYRFTEPPVIATPSLSLAAGSGSSSSSSSSSKVVTTSPFSSLAAGSGSSSSSSSKVASPVKAWGVKYSSIRKHIQPGNFLKLAQREEESGHFKGLPQTLPFNDDLYWSRVSSGALALSQERPVITYPADNPASILETLHDFPKAWNIGTLDKESDLLRAIMPDLDFYEDTIEGYTSSALYIGASGTTFALHAEDMNLASVNYLIAGAPKVWYCVPPSEYTKVVDLISKIFAGSSLVKSCPQAVMHKQFLVHPDTLRDHGIVCSRIVQQPGDLIITHPGAFHFGYNTGFNIAEATNFATSEWYTGGHLQDSWNVGRCSCLSDSRFYFKKELVLKVYEG